MTEAEVEESRMFWLREAQENAGKAIGCLFEVVRQVTGVAGIPAPHCFFNAQAFADSYMEANIEYALLCAREAERRSAARKTTPNERDALEEMQ